MKNRLTDLNDILFAQLERLTDDDLSTEQIAQEVERTQSVVQIADRIVNTAQLQLNAARLIADHGGRLGERLPNSLGLPSGLLPGETK